MRSLILFRIGELLLQSLKSATFEKLIEIAVALRNSACAIHLHGDSRIIVFLRFKPRLELSFLHFFVSPN
ncbi:hypothetical protein ASD87_11220 [Achromobacter sp. Root170]|nr:hypothetical protein ASD87_11220 [Achromobacter sp. Root170]